MNTISSITSFAAIYDGVLPWLSIALSRIYGREDIEQPHVFHHTLRSSLWRLEFAKFLVKTTFDINRKDRHETSALIAAVQEQNLQVAKVLLENDVNLEYRTKGGRRVIHFAILNDALSMAEMIEEQLQSPCMEETLSWNVFVNRE